MIRTLLAGMARVTFQAALLAFLIGLLLGYASFRLLRASVVSERGQPVREAGFAVLAAVVVLGRALAARRATTPRAEEDDHADLADV